MQTFAQHSGLVAQSHTTRRLRYGEVSTQIDSTQVPVQQGLLLSQLSPVSVRNRQSRVIRLRAHRMLRTWANYAGTQGAGKGDGGEAKARDGEDLGNGEMHVCLGASVFLEV